MARGGEGRSGTRPGLVAGVLLGWVVVIAVAAGTATDATNLIGIANLDVVYALVLGLLALAGLAILIFVRPFSGKWSEPNKKRNYAWIVLIGLFLLALWKPDVAAGFLNPETQEGERIPREELVEVGEVEEVPREPVAQTTDVLLVIVALGAVAGLVFWVRRNNAESPMWSPSGSFEIDDELHQAIAGATYELDANVDPRTAVLNAYAVLETVFRERGDPRGKAETASEHLARVMQPLPIQHEPFAQLGELYEIARFSTRPITAQDQRRAGAALQQARHELDAQIHGQQP